jgi:hypothetical protein
MQKIYSRLIELLGRTDSDPKVSELISELNDSQMHDSESEGLRLLWFTSHGCIVEFWKPSRICMSLAFHLATAAVEAGNMKRYEGDFPFGITAKDSREQVEHQIGVIPKRSELPGSKDRPTKSYRDEYALPDMTLSFLFDSLTGEMHLLSVSIWDLEMQDN